eukprot:scaffold204300_cov14-Tisochrysis_lutea.AAC.1
MPLRKVILPVLLTLSVSTEGALKARYRSGQSPSRAPKKSDPPCAVLECIDEGRLEARVLPPRVMGMHANIPGGERVCIKAFLRWQLESQTTWDAWGLPPIVHYLLSHLRTRLRVCRSRYMVDEEGCWGERKDDCSSLHWRPPPPLAGSAAVGTVDVGGNGISNAAASPRDRAWGGAAEIPPKRPLWCDDVSGLLEKKKPQEAREEAED